MGKKNWVKHTYNAETHKIEKEIIELKEGEDAPPKDTPIVRDVKHGSLNKFERKPVMFDKYEAEAIKQYEAAEKKKKAAKMQAKEEVSSEGDVNLKNYPSIESNTAAIGAGDKATVSQEGHSDFVEDIKDAGDNSGQDEKPNVEEPVIDEKKVGEGDNSQAGDNGGQGDTPNP